MFKLRKIKNYQLETRIFRKRLFFATIIIGCLIGLLVIRLFYLQVFQNKYYTNLAQHNQRELFPIEPNRGLIYDRNGVLLAENIPIFTLAIIPDYVTDIDNTVKELQNIIEINQDNLRQFYRALKQRQPYEHIPLKYKLGQEEVANFYVNQYHFPGVVIDANLIRHYPLGETMVSVIGYVGKVNPQDLKNNSNNANYNINSFVGRLGIEKFYETDLRGQLGYQEVEIDAGGHITRTTKNTAQQPGNNLYLTIDSKLQQSALDALGEEKGAVVAIEPNSGEVLALVSKPAYDPNLFAYGIDPEAFQELQNSPDKPMYNRAIRGHFPPASTIKPFIALQGLDTNTITPSFSIYDKGWFKLPNSEHVYRDWQAGGHGSVNVAKAIISSCDTFFYTLASKLGIAKLDSMLYRFGFGSKTNIDLGEELAGIVASPEWKQVNVGKIWYPGDTVLSGIGQGFMSATPLQLASATATLAERGVRFQPHLLLKSIHVGGKITEQKLIVQAEINLKNPKDWDLIIKAMQSVVMNPGGTAYARFGPNPPYTVAGKTGTAQLFRHRFNEENGTFESETGITKRLRNHSLFIAFAPVDNPKIALAVVVENGATAPIAARKIIDSYLLTPEELQKQQEKTIVPQKSIPEQKQEDEEEVLNNEPNFTETEAE